jgi:hypothetical protein
MSSDLRHPLDRRVAVLSNPGRMLQITDDDLSQDSACRYGL